MGYRRDQKTQAPLPFLPLTLEKLQKKCIFKKINDGADVTTNNDPHRKSTPGHFST